MIRQVLRAALMAPVVAWACSAPTPDYDGLIRGGMVYDGSGDPPRTADVAIAGDTIAGRSVDGV